MAFKNFLNLESYKAGTVGGTAGGFPRAKRKYMMHEFWNGGVFIERNDPSVSNARADGVQVLKAEWRIEQMRWNNASQRSADDDTFQRRVIAQAAADFFDNLSHGHTEFDLVKTRSDEERIERHDFWSCALMRETERSDTPHRHDETIHGTFTSVSTLLMSVGFSNILCSVGYGGRANHLRASALHPAKHRRFFAANITALPNDDLDVE